jgi:hypothetical protein
MTKRESKSPIKNLSVMINILGDIAEGVIDGSVSLQTNKQAHAFASKIIAICRRFAKSNASEQHDAAVTLLALLKALSQPAKPVKPVTRKRPNKPTTARKVGQGHPRSH